MEEGETEPLLPGKRGALHERPERAGDGEVAHQLAVDEVVEILGVGEDGIDPFGDPANRRLIERFSPRLEALLAAWLAAADRLGDACRPQLADVRLADPALDSDVVHLAGDEQDRPVGNGHEHRRDHTPRDHPGEDAHREQQREKDQQAREREEHPRRPDVGENSGDQPDGKDENPEQAGNEEQGPDILEDEQLPARDRADKEELERPLPHHVRHERRRDRHAHQEEDRASQAGGEELLKDEDFEPQRRSLRAGQFDAVAEEGEAVGPEEAEIASRGDRHFPGLRTDLPGPLGAGLADFRDCPELAVGDLPEPVGDLLPRLRHSHQRDERPRQRRLPVAFGEIGVDRLGGGDRVHRSVEPAGDIAHRLGGDVDAVEIGGHRPGGDVEILPAPRLRFDPPGQRGAEEDRDCQKKEIEDLGVEELAPRIPEHGGERPRQHRLHRDASGRVSRLTRNVIRFVHGVPPPSAIAR